jgi:hypothetical protein
MNSWTKRLLGFGSEWRYAKRLWQGIGTNGRRIIIVPCEVDNAEDPATGNGECRSAALACVCVGAIGKKDVSIIFAKELFRGSASLAQKSRKEKIKVLQNELGGADVILLGSSLANIVTEIALELIKEQEPTLDIGAGRSAENRNHYIVFDGKKYPTEYQSDTDRSPHTMTADYGCIVVRPNCFSSAGEGGQIFIFSGAHTYGTQAAAELVFCPQGASQIAQRYAGEIGELQQTWRHNLTALIKVAPTTEECQGIPMIPLKLTQRSRHVEILKPTRLEGVQIENPVMAPALDRFRFYINWGVWTTVGLEGCAFLAMLLMTVGLYFHYWPLVIATLGFYIVERIIHRKYE